jgi:hypothetical protein
VCFAEVDVVIGYSPDVYYCGDARDSPSSPSSSSSSSSSEEEEEEEEEVEEEDGPVAVRRGPRWSWKAPARAGNVRGKRENVGFGFAGGMESFR